MRCRSPREDGTTSDRHPCAGWHFANRSRLKEGSCLPAPEDGRQRGRSIRKRVEMRCPAAGVSAAAVVNSIAVKEGFDWIHCS